MSRKLLLSLLLAAGIALRLHGQTLEPQYGAPLQELNVCGGQSTFKVKINGAGAACGSATLTIAMPAGYNYVPGSAAIAGASGTVTETSASGTGATLAVGAIPAAPDSAVITYSVYADCSLIGSSAPSTVSYSLAGCTGTSTAISNDANALSADLNAVVTSNVSYLGAPGSSFTRNISIANNGFGAISEFTFTDTSDNGVTINSITASTGTVSSLATLAISGGRTVYTVTITAPTANGMFNQGESLVITEQNTLAACTGGQSSMNAFFGCNGALCAQNGANGTAVAGAGVDPSYSPNIVTSWTSSAPACFTAAGTDYPYTLTITNNGTGPAMNIHVPIATDNTVYVNGVDTALTSGLPFQTAYSIAGGSIEVSTDNGATYTPYTPVSTNNYGNGSISGFHAYFASLSGGASIKLRFNMHVTNYSNCGFVLTPPLRSKFTNWTGQCSATPFVSASGSSATGNSVVRLGGSSTETQPVAYEGEDYFIDVLGNFQNINSTGIQQSDAYTDFVFTLPCGLLPQNNAGDIQWFGTPAVSSTFIDGNGKLHVRIMPAPDNNSSFDLRIRTVVDCGVCTNPGGTTSIAMVYNNNPGCSSDMTVGCITTENTAIVCNSTGTGTCTSIINRKRSSYRVNYGQPDDNNDHQVSGVANPALYRLDRAVRGDTIETLNTATIAAGGSFAYAGAVVVANGSGSAVPHAAGLTASLYVKDASSGTVYNLSGIPVTTHTASAQDSLLVNLDAASLVAYGLPAGFMFSGGDSLALRVRSVINSSCPVTYNPAIYVATVANASATSASAQSCGSMAPSRIFSAKAVPTISLQTSSAANSCNRGSANLFTSVAISRCNSQASGSNMFPYEVREFALPYYLAIDTAHGAGTVWANQLSFYDITPGVNSGAASFNTAPDSTSGDYFYYKLSSLRALTSTYTGPVDENWSYRLDGSWNQVAPCAATAASFMPHGKVRTPDYYTTAGLYVDTVLSATGSNIHFTPTQLPVVTVAGITYTATGNTAFWDIALRNPSNNQSLSNLWLGRDLTVASGVTITGISQQSSFGGTVTGNLSQTNGVYAIPGSVSPLQTRYYRISATIGGCNTDSLSLAYGFNCSGQPSSTALTPCTQTKLLRVITLAPQVQLAFVSQPMGPQDLCGIYPYELQTTNSGQGTATTLRTSVALPAATAYVAGTFQVEYPVGSGYSSVADANVTVTGSTATFAIPAAMLASITTGQVYRIKFSLQGTGCGFKSSSRIRATPVADQACGAVISGTRQNSLPIKINGAPANPNSYVLSSHADTAFACGGGDVVTSYHFSLVNNGPGVSNANDLFSTNMPLHWQLLPGSVTYSHNPGGTAAYTATTTEADGTNTYEFATGTGLAVGDSIVYDAQIKLPAAFTGNESCGQTDPISESALSTFTATCTSSGATCISKDETAARDVTRIIVERPRYSIINATANYSTGTQNVSGTVNLVHNNAYGIDQNTNITVYSDLNNNGTVDATDQLLGTQALPITGTNATPTVNYSINAGALSCNTCPILVTAAMDCGCAIAQLSIALPVEFVSVTANALDGCTARIRWNYHTTPGAIPASYEIARSADGRTYTTVATAAAEATSVDDVVPQGGTWYYQVKALAPGMAQVVSRTAAVTVAGCTAAGLSMAPNPAATQVTIRLYAGSGAPAAYHINDITGRTVLSGMLNATGTALVNVAGLPAGTYMAIITQDGNRWTEKLMIVR